MPVVLWTVQAVLALLYLAGGAYKAFQGAELARQMPALSAGGWAVFGVIEMVGAVLLVVPAALKWMPALSPAAAVALTVETLAVGAVYARYSLGVTASNPLTWAVAMAVLAAFVACGRYGVSPLA